MKIKNQTKENLTESHYSNLWPIFRGLLIIFFVFVFMVFIVAIRGDFPALRAELYKISFFKNLIDQREETIVTAKATRLVFETPAFDQLKIFINDPTGFNPALLDEYKVYYERVVSSLPQIAEAHAILGVIYFYQEDQSKAFIALQNAYHLQPKFFWNLHNLASIYYLKKDYVQSAAFFLKALESDPIKSLEYIYRSRPYNQIYWAQKDLNDLTLRQSMGKGYQQTRKLLLESYFRIGKYQNIIFLSKKFIEANLDEKGEFYFWAGLAHFKRNEMNEARGYLKRAIDRGKEDEAVYYYAARCAESLGEKKLFEEFISKVKQSMDESDFIFEVNQKPILQIL